MVDARKKIKAMRSLAMKEDLVRMTRVLRRLRYCNKDNIIQIQGKVAAEITTCDELMFTELFFDGVFNDMTPPQIASLLSTFIASESKPGNKKTGSAAEGESNSSGNSSSSGTSSTSPAPLRKNKMKISQGGKEGLPVPPEVGKAFTRLKQLAKRLGEIMVECKMEVTVEEMVEKYSPDLMMVVLKWCDKNTKFAQICSMLKDTNLYEGQIIRCIHRLEELLRQASAAAKAVGEETLEEKFTAAIALMKRDIVFAPSLYL